MGLTGLVIKAAVPLPKLEEYDRFLFIGPHPDDIEIGAGATAARLAAAGKKVCFLICTDGRFGDGNVSKDMTAEELIALRRQESVASAAFLGVTDVRFLELSDGGFYAFEDLVKGIAKVAGEFAPEVIFAPDPDVDSECHVDHLRVGTAAKQVACHAPYPGIMKGHGAAGTAPVAALAFYMTARPNRFVKTTGFLKKQLESVFSHHLSQFPEGCNDAKTIALYLKVRSVDFGLRSFCRSAEGFRVLGQTHMHCLPES